MFDFANRLKRLQEMSGLNQQEFSDFCNINKGAMSRYQSGKMTPGLETALELAKINNVTLDWLVGYGSIDNPERRKNGLYSIPEEK